MYKNFAALFVVVIGIAGCGGGGGGGTSSSSVVTAPAPTISLTSNKSKVSIGSSANIIWTSTNATACTASGAWSGVQTTAGTSAQTPATAGTNSYTLTCTGAGGSVNQSVALTVPIPVQKSSYLNAKNNGLPPQTLPTLSKAGETITAGYAFGDFFQDGSYSMVAFSNDFSQLNSTGVPTTPGKAYFFKRDANGKWQDHTQDILANQTGCINPRKVIVADFNNDGIPDVFASCHGLDAAPFPGETPRILMSQPDGSYKNVAAPMNCFCHSASAADINGDGFADIVVADTSVNKQPFVLINNKDGTFTADYNRMPPSTQKTIFSDGSSSAQPIYSVELIDFDGNGKYGLLLMADEILTGAHYQTSIFPNDGTGNFTTATRILLPTDQTYTLPLDVVFANGSIYLFRTANYTAAAIQKIDYASKTSAMIYTHTGPYANGSYWFEWIVPYQGNIVTSNAVYSVSVNQ
jgi:hypothetical protein